MLHKVRNFGVMHTDLENTSKGSAIIAMGANIHKNFVSEKVIMETPGDDNFQEIWIKINILIWYI